MAHEQLHQIAADFFRVFSRTEYALKASGFNNGNGPAEANWGNFARAVEAAIGSPSTPELRQAIEYILNEPPKKQFIENGLIEWRDTAPQTNSNSDALFQYIRRIRNNLFHGGKFNGHWFAPERSERLINASLIILQAAVEMEPSVREAYHG
ncbi:hypothetical protein [Pseudomonas sp. EA_35y_Pfl2_R5]|uniref:hypothetical protein n=1 Tax=Pseudomonas sp. EA_35y_Pfl2_R5 TaxID=3088690 RepID=UPI0030DC85A8